MKRWIALPATALIIGVAAVAPTFAQDGQPGGNLPAAPSLPSLPNLGDGPMGRGPGMGGGFQMPCSTTNPTDTVATALGITATELRVALVSGQTVSDLAASKGVDLQTIQDALTTQRQADLDQALADGLITQEVYDSIKDAQAKIQENMPDGVELKFEIPVPDHNVVNRETVVADALGITCAELITAVRDGSTIAEIASDKGVEVQTVIDAVVTAVKDAAAKDVEEGLITQAQADGRLNGLENKVGEWVYSNRSGGFGDFGGFDGGRGDRGGRGNGQGDGRGNNDGRPNRPGNDNGRGNGQPGNPPANGDQPDAQPTTEATPTS
ncbi:MAG TPA: hypothetical protein VHL11_12200 [Phototrophicaceae bacterium]|nr:hypothetical protein [Phototrophicaceae bacterium]